MKKHLKFLNDNKGMFGLSDWKIMLKAKLLDLGDNFAEVKCDIYEKELRIAISKKLKKQSFAYQKNVLLHELLHARYEIFQNRIQELIKYEEENFINDIIRGIEKLI
jgi:hypothetical protein